jgi:regulator of sigma E protease
VNGTPELAQLGTLLLRVVAIVGIFLILIVPHEGGHFALAKLFRVPVYEYSIGMGTRLWSRVRSGTLYAIRLIPIGGYVRMAGMEPSDFDTPGGFHSKPAYQRLAILLAGPFVNFVVAAVLVGATGVVQSFGDPGQIVAVQLHSPAYGQGLRPGDSVRSVDGQRVTDSTQIIDLEQRHPGQPLHLVVRRPNGSMFETVVTPAYNKTARRYLMGIETQEVPTLGQALVSGVTFPALATVAIAEGVYELANGQIPGGFFGPSGLSGPVGFSYVAYQAAAQGVFSYLQIAALLSMALGLTNLLPMPPLDGSKILIVLLEKARGRPFDRERALAVERVGLYALLALIAFITILDVQRIATGQFGLK